MLDAGFNIEARADDLDATPLNYAATTGDAAMVDLLLARGAAAGCHYTSMAVQPISTAVYCAAHFNSGRRTTMREVVRSLLAAGGRSRRHSLELALEHHLDDIVEVLKEHGASL